MLVPVWIPLFMKTPCDAVFFFSSLSFNIKSNLLNARIIICVNLVRCCSFVGSLSLFVIHCNRKGLFVIDKPKFNVFWTLLYYYEIMPLWIFHNMSRNNNLFLSAIGMNQTDVKRVFTVSCLSAFIAPCLFFEEDFRNREQIVRFELCAQLYSSLKRSSFNW